MTDYLQPDFYRFNEDSLGLVHEICSSGGSPGSILDVGAGSGVIGIESAIRMKIPVVHFLELQKEWAPYLSENIKNYLPHREIRMFWTSIGKWVPEFSYDLIVGNPPYFLPGNGRLPSDPVRARCRSFLEDGWQVLLRKSSDALSPRGRAIFVTAVENTSHVRAAGKNLPLEIVEKGQIAIVKINPTECKSRS